MLLAVLALAAVVGCAPATGGDAESARTGPDRTRDTSPAPGPSSGEQAAGTRAGLVTTVERIVDGDTLYLADLDERLRLIGIDTPETRHPDRGVECFGRRAAAHLADLVPPGTAVRVVFDVERRDRYGRPLGYLYRAEDDRFVNRAMVADGYARVSTVPPNVARAEVLRAAERRARAAGRGLWTAC